MRVTRERAVLVARLTAHGVFSTGGAPRQIPDVSECQTSSSFRFTPPKARRGLKGIIPTASQALRIFFDVKASLGAGIRIL